MPSGRIALIAGRADDSIVRSVALSLALHGAKTAFAYTEPEQDSGAAASVEELVHAVRDLGGEAIALPLSEAQQGAADKLVRDVISAYGAVDLLVSRV